MNFKMKTNGLKNKPFLQSLGLVLITLSIALLLFKLILLALPNGKISSLNGTEMSVMFFIIMLGIAFVFPELLSNKDKEASTMRIVVFMMVNVICILLIKIGWSKHSLGDIGLDANWMGVIAFVFGAKATQSFFENRSPVPPVSDANSSQQINQSDLAKRAILQNEVSLKTNHPNIASISDAVHDLNGITTHVVAIYLSDNNTVDLPDKLEALLEDGSKRTIGTEIIKNVGSGQIQISQKADNISDSSSSLFRGSVCCLVKSTTNETFTGVLTAGHVFSDGRFTSCGGLVAPQQQGSSLLNLQAAGHWHLQLINNFQDLAVARLSTPPPVDSNYIKMAGGYHDVTDADVVTPDTNVTLISFQSKRDAFIIDYNVAFDIKYKDNQTIRMNNIILIGTSRIRENSLPVSIPGDSGCCIISKTDNKLVGMLLGANDKYSFVLPVKKTLETYNLKPL